LKIFNRKHSNSKTGFVKKTWIAALMACMVAVSACAEGNVYTAELDDQSAVDVGGT